MSRYQRGDRFFQKAKQEQFAARSVYKLEEIDQRFKVVKKGAWIVDLGCAPGSWLQYLAEAVGPKGGILGYDLAPLEINPGPRVLHRHADVFALTPEAIRADFDALRKKLEHPPVASETEVMLFDALLSDMAPKLTGIRDADQIKSVGLALQALALAERLVKPGGAFVAKTFQGREIDDLVTATKRQYKEVKLLKPEATRDGSREVFVIGRMRKP